MMNKGNISEKYEKLEKIGEGAFGVVYLGENKETKEKVAIKEIPIKIIENEDFKMDIRAETEKEIKFMRIYNFSPNSVKLYDVFDEGKIIYMVLELCDSDIAKCLEKSKNGFTIYEIKYIMSEFNKILYEIRKRDMLHFDVKLENLLVKFKKDSKEFEIKLTDYGQTRLVSTTKDLSNNEWDIEPCKDYDNETLKEMEKTDLINLGVDICRMLFKDSFKNFKSLKDMIDEVDKNVKDEDLKDLLNGLLVEDYKKRLNWDDYFNHKFFKIENFDFDKIENIKRN